ncbi:MAG: DNA-processing protein DprA [Treponema sp.]|jgi:DNA processing protein|nr:DNA-processing protein DprA [Treponema sp.]
MVDRGLLDLIINRIPGLRIPERLVLCEKFDREEEISILSKEDIEKIINRPLKQSWLMDELCLQAGQDERTARFRGIRWVSWTSGDYPPQLREIYDPPAVLFFRGSLPDPEKPLAAVVGTRRPGPAAAAQAYDISRELGAAGLSVVSGLALGIDALAHRGNLEGGVPTFAVLGSGADEIYPAGNRKLAMRILDNGGGILSEYVPGMKPFRGNFPARNRIIAGLARGTVIVEAPARSGALITARFALEQGRDLWVASAGTVSSCGAGTAKLADDGAKVIHGAAAILAEWKWTVLPFPAAGESRAGADGEISSGGRELAASLARSLKINL